MTKSRKKKRNQYRENRIRILKRKIRGVWPILAICGGFCLVLFLSAGLSRLYHSLLDAPWLKVEEIEIAGLKSLERTKILDSMGVSRGECILNLRMGPVAERLKALPTVKSASVRLDLPGRIVVEIAEKEPLALVKGNDFYLMDENGMLIARALPEENRRLVLITGLCGPKLKEGDSIPARHLGRVKEVISALNEARHWLPASSVKECRWDPGGVTLVLGERGVPVEIGQENVSRKLARLKKVIATLDERQWRELVTRIDLDYPDRAYLDGRFPVPRTVPGQGKQAS
ncbi:MAG: cell division protein FtsQ/DivIB [Syntrophobacteraceae bacterium]